MDKEVKKQNKTYCSETEASDKQDEWIDFLYFAYKKAKHFVTKETSFVNEVEIIQFESNLGSNITSLAKLLENETKLKKEIENMEGHLYFFPKSFGPNKQPRIRPKVTFPFKYQILWAAVILRIGEWFDTESNLKNVFSMRDENIRSELDWMVPWSFNGRLKRLTDNKNQKIESSYIQYNNSRLYESHQMALRKFNAYELESTKKIFEKNEKVYKAELDIAEFFPTLKKEYVIDMFSSRLDTLQKINCFKEMYFDPEELKKTINILLDINIIYPDTIKENDPILEVLVEYYKLITKEEKGTEETKSGNDIIPKLVIFLNDKLPLDLIASNFISNCVLNHFVDSKIKDNQENNIFILRYTDDYTILSSDKEKVIKKIDKIKAELKNIELTYSTHKTLPTTVRDIEDNLDYLSKERGWLKTHCKSIKDWFSFETSKSNSSIHINIEDEFLDEIKIKSQMVGINIEPIEKSSDNIHEDLFSSKLSTSSDIKLQALSDEELTTYIDELLVYLEAEGKLGELEEDTVKIFAAWRLNSSHQERLQRESHDIEDIKELLNILEGVIKKYPTKLGFYDVYLLLLLRIIESSESGINELEAFLMKVKILMKASFPEIKNDEQERNKANEFISSCFPSVRSRILNLISNNWKRFDEEKRERLREILENVFLEWYAEPNVKWDELYVMYSSFFVLRIKLPLSICNEPNDYPEFVSEIANVYNNYNFMIEKNTKEEDIKRNCNIPKVTVKEIINGIGLFKKGLYWNKVKREFSFNEADKKIYNNLKKNLTEIQDEYDLPESKNYLLYSKLEIAKIAPERLETNDFNFLTSEWIVKSNEKQDIKQSYETIEELKYELLDFLQQCILKYFEKPTKYSAVLDWIENDSKESNDFKSYVKERFNSFAIIRSYFSRTDERFPSLITNERGDDLKIPIADWVFYCQTLPFHLETTSMKQRVLHPLTEYEFVKLLDLIICCSYQNEESNKDLKKSHNNDLFESHLFDIKMSPGQWEKFRNGERNECEKGSNDKNNKADSNLKNSDDIEEQTEKLVKSLFSLLTNRPWHTHVIKGYSMYKWNDLQSYFEMTYYPSTAVASLFVNHLNIHQDFYAKHYKMPIEELPYREVYTKNNSKDIVKWKNEYLRKQVNNQVYKTDNRKLELLEIDIDQLRG